MAPFFASSFQPHTHHGLTDMHVVRHDGSRTVRKDVQRPFRPPSLCAQSQKMIESEHFSFMPGGLFQAHLLVVNEHFSFMPDGSFREHLLVVAAVTA